MINMCLLALKNDALEILWWPFSNTLVRYALCIMAETILIPCHELHEMRISRGDKER